MRILRLVLAVFGIGWPAAHAQTPSGTAAVADTVVALPDIEVVEAAPYRLSAGRAPLALAVRTRSAAEVATTPALTLDAALAGLPGVWVSGRESYAQGERLLVRGLGWRAAFGVRGTHVLLDGVPLTLPDGQTQLNVVDPALIERAEVIRGPASTFWGSGAGGVVALSTESDAVGLRARVLGGGYGVASGTVAVRPSLGPGRRLAAWGSYLDDDGFRDHSAVRLWRAGVSGGAALGGGRELGVVALLAHMPRAESPGGITFEAAEQDPRQTRALVLERDASKALTQTHLAVSLAQPFGARVRLRATGHAGLRALDNPIVPRYIELDRRTAGLRVTAEGETLRWDWAVGAEGEVQHDDRLETANEGGRPGADVLTDQREAVRSGALFGRLAVPLTSRLTATAALRGDLLRYRADPAGAPVDTRTTGAVSPSVGLAYAWYAGPRLAGTVFANAAGALDAPTTTELGNRADGLPGFDPDLEPERTWGAEAGGRAAMQLPRGGALGFDVAVYAAVVQDLLVPFEEGDVTFYRNEGRTRHVGVELGVQPADVPLAGGRLDGGLAYAWTRARFAEGAGTLAVDGNAVPGLPEHLATGTLTWTGPAAWPLVVGMAVEAASAYAADSRNEAETTSYAVLHGRLGWAGLRVAGARWSPFAAVRNVFDVRYAGSVVVNAFGGRYAEPAAGRHLLVGLTLSVE